MAPAVSAPTSASPAAIQFVVGKNGLDVNLWQIDNALWSARYRDPYLLLNAGQHSDTIYCEYDILTPRHPCPGCAPPLAQAS